MATTQRRIEAIVADILAAHGVTSPPVPVEVLAKKQGVQVRLQPLESDISGFLYRDSRQSVIGVNSTQSKVRQRFTIAHELGHLMLHHGDAVHVDRVFFVKMRDDVSGKGTDPDEIEANRFAAELLIPRTFITRDLQKLGSVDLEDDAVIARVARHYNVSTQALLLRLVNLGYVNGYRG